jgi:hypothetical protein
VVRVGALIEARGVAAYSGSVAAFDWDTFDLEKLVEELQENPGGPEGASMIYAFEEALRVARLDERLLSHFLAATVCLLARVEESSPREILEGFFRRSVSDAVWRERYLPLFT